MTRREFCNKHLFIALVVIFLNPFLPLAHYVARRIFKAGNPMTCGYLVECIDRGFFPGACPCLVPPPWKAEPEGAPKYPEGPEGAPKYPKGPEELEKR